MDQSALTKTVTKYRQQIWTFSPQNRPKLVQIQNAKYVFVKVMHMLACGVVHCKVKLF